MPAENWRVAAYAGEAAGLMGDVAARRYLVKDAPCGTPARSRCTEGHGRP